MTQGILLTNSDLLNCRLNLRDSRQDMLAYPLYFLFRPESLAL